MSRELLALGLALGLLVAGLPTPAAGQGLEDSLEEAEAKSRQLAEDTREDPQAMAANASDPSWQADQADWTQAWACRSAEAAHPAAGQAAEQTPACPAAGSARAGEDEAQQAEDNGSVARAEEAEPDAERAARDQVAATEDFAQATASDPENAPEHAATFVDRTLVFAERVVAAVENALGLGLAGIDGSLEAVQGVGLASAEGLAAAAGTVQEASTSGLDTLASAASWTLEQPAAIAAAGVEQARGLDDALAQRAEAIQGGLQALGQRLGLGSEQAPQPASQPDGWADAERADEGIGDAVDVDTELASRPPG